MAYHHEEVVTSSGVGNPLQVAVALIAPLFQSH